MNEQPETEQQQLIKNSILELQQKLDQEIPDFPILLAEIHRNLREDPALVLILTDEEIGTIVSGLVKHKDVQIVKPTAAKSEAKRVKEQLKNISADDL